MKSYHAKMHLKKFGFLLVVLASIAVGYRLNQAPVEFVELYRMRLHVLDLRAISRELDVMGIEHTVSEAEHSIKVDARHRFRAQAIVAQVGLPALNPVPSVQCLTSESPQLQALIENEMVSALRQISGVQDAKVMLGLPNKKYFVDDATPVTSRVFLKVENEERLTPVVRCGIRALLSHSVPELSEQNVTIFLVSDEGKSEPPRSFIAEEAEMLMERAAGARLQDGLDKLLGENTSSSVDLVNNYSGGKSAIKKMVVKVTTSNFSEKMNPKLAEFVKHYMRMDEARGDEVIIYSLPVGRR